VGLSLKTDPMRTGIDTNEEFRYFIQGVKDSLVVILAAGASLASLYAFYNYI
jgi:hypothetical protein